MSDKKFELTDLSSGKKSLLPVHTGSIGPDVIDVAAINKDHGVFTFDPGFGVTAATESKITYIDGDAGVLLHRGYPIEQLAENSSFMEVAYLLLNGDLQLRQRLQDPLDRRPGSQPRRLRRLPPVLHRQAEDGRHRRSRRQVPQEVRCGCRGCRRQVGLT